MPLTIRVGLAQFMSTTWVAAKPLQLMGPPPPPPPPPPAAATLTVTAAVALPFALLAVTLKVLVALMLAVAVLPDVALVGPLQVQDETAPPPQVAVSETLPGALRLAGLALIEHPDGAPGVVPTGTQLTTPDGLMVNELQFGSL